MAIKVSIQLISPASGDLVDVVLEVFHFNSVSIQLISPASGDDKEYVEYLNLDGSRFHSINIPSEWGLHNPIEEIGYIIEFPFN